MEKMFVREIADSRQIQLDELIMPINYL